MVDRPLWRVPEFYVDKARESMGGLDLDLSMPAAETLAQPWSGRVFLVVPMRRGAPLQFISKLLQEISAANVLEAVLLTHNASCTKWFHLATRACTRLCFPKGRIKFFVGDAIGLPLQGQCFFYFGWHAEKFTEAFADIGWIGKRFGVA